MEGWFGQHKDILLGEPVDDKENQKINKSGGFIRIGVKTQVCRYFHLQLQKENISSSWCSTRISSSDLVLEFTKKLLKTFEGEMEDETGIVACLDLARKTSNILLYEIVLRIMRFYEANHEVILLTLEKFRRLVSCLAAKDNAERTSSFVVLVDKGSFVINSRVTVDVSEVEKERSGRLSTAILNQVEILFKDEATKEKGERARMDPINMRVTNGVIMFYKYEGKRRSLNWSKRYSVIIGITRGLLYLHQDSRLRIIHRDLKASNILLDAEMNPRISDFGLTRSLEGSDTSANTKRVMGTYGYMAPEYTIDWIYSTKSYVFSFGVLDITSSWYRTNLLCTNMTTIAQAWRLYNNRKHVELIDSIINGSYIESEVSRAVHIGLLCVQKYPEDRLDMPMVVLMLCSQIPLPEPKQPGFYTERRPQEANSSSDNF
ncbi:G-type lectin S-receptor-like serine/threonine-protein kinase isoform X1 [Tanacetum coccineum]|uniref:G-type lectin S-receptor-like serine/threonine-protein kinase isoform X1 n=1 Tax=Tanacetum coccineum TaxID=301880 RepID=A0ABQ4WXA4_9ASTR